MATRRGQAKEAVLSTAAFLSSKSHLDRDRFHFLQVRGLIAASISTSENKKVVSLEVMSLLMEPRYFDFEPRLTDLLDVKQQDHCLSCL